MNAKYLTIVTGGGRGLGRVIALRMAKETSIFIIGRTLSDLDATYQEIVATGTKAICMVGDVTDPDTAEKCKSFCSDFTVRNLVCNAGIGMGGPTEKFSAADWVRMFDVNVHGAFHFIRTFLPEMIENENGNISLISSTAGLKGLKRGMAYSATKAALNAMAQSITAEHSKNGINCVAVCPNYVAGGMTDRSIKTLARHRGISEDQARQIIINSTPEKRLIPEEEVAEAVASICTGELFPPNSVHIINGEKP